MSKGLLVFTEGKEVIGARVSKVNFTSDAIEIYYDYKADNVIYTGILKATSRDGVTWSGEWTDKDQRWKATSGKLEMTGGKVQDRGVFYGTWGNNDQATGEELSFSIEFPRGYR